jgi:hypothetical protein
VVPLKYAPYDWQQFVRLSGATAQQIKALSEVARERGSRPEDWRVRFGPVPATCWLAIEVWNGHRWLPYPGWTKRGR